MSRQLSGQQGRGGFTLLELLVVLGVISVLVVLSVPMLSSMGQGQALTKASQQMKGQFELARQLAQTKNQRVELRFYLGSGNELMATQVVSLDEDGNSEKPETMVSPLPEQVASLSANPFSTLLTGAPTAKTVDRGDSWTSPSPDFAYVLFQPGGRVGLGAPTSGQTWTITLVEKQNAEATTLPDNFATLVFRPMTGLVQVVRPE